MNQAEAFENRWNFLFKKSPEGRQRMGEIGSE